MGVHHCFLNNESLERKKGGKHDMETHKDHVCYAKAATSKTTEVQINIAWGQQLCHIVQADGRIPLTNVQNWI